jgi:hypothetical protein
MLAGAIVAGTLAQVAPSNAVLFNWSYDGGPGVSGGGTFDATFLGGVTYQVNSISGTANGSTIFGVSGYSYSNNQVYYDFPLPPPASFVQVDRLGLAFSVGDGSVSYNIYEDYGGFPIGDPYYCGAIYCLVGPGPSGGDGSGDMVVALTSFTATPVLAVPEPATWAMMLIGFASLGFAGRQWNRRAIAVAVKA